MSHTWGYGRHVFYHDNSLTGETKITQQNGDKRVEIDVPTQLLVRYVADLVRTKKIAQLEDASWNAVLGLPEDAK